MKKPLSISFLSLFLTLLFVSCEKQTNFTESVSETKEVVFRLSTFFLDVIPITKSGDDKQIASDPNNLIVFDVVDNSVVQTYRRTTSTVDANSGIEQIANVLSDLKLPLTKGTHDLYFLASTNSYDSYSTDDVTVTWGPNNRLQYVWANKITIDVTNSSPSTEQVQMPIIVSRIDLVCKDAQPTDISKIKISGKMCWTIDLKNMVGIVPETAITYEMPYSYTDKDAGKTFATMSFVPNGSQIHDVTFTALKTENAADVEIAHYTIDDIALTVGHINRYSGNLYGPNGTFSMSVVKEWTNIVEHTF